MMKYVRVKLLSLLIISVFLFHACEKEPAENKQVNTDYLISIIFKEGKIYQEYIYNEGKKLIRVNYYHDDSVYYFDAYKYNIIGQVIKKEYSDDYFEIVFTRFLRVILPFVESRCIISTRYRI